MKFSFSILFFSDYVAFRASLEMTVCTKHSVNQVLLVTHFQIKTNDLLINQTQHVTLITQGRPLLLFFSQNVKFAVQNYLQICFFMIGSKVWLRFVYNYFQMF